MHLLLQLEYISYGYLNSDGRINYIFKIFMHALNSTQWNRCVVKKFIFLMRPQNGTSYCKEIHYLLKWGHTVAYGTGRGLSSLFSTLGNLDDVMMQPIYKHNDVVHLVRNVPQGCLD